MSDPVRARLVFMGTPEFALPSLRILADNDYAIVAVVTGPDKPAGRGQRMSMSPVKTFALDHSLPVLQPERLKDAGFADALRALKPDIIVVVAFRILPPEVLAIPSRGAFNLHASLLPRYRGAAPINWAIMNGETETGVTTFFLREQVDTGNIILQARVPVGKDESAGELHDRLSEVGAELVLHTVRLIELGKASPKPQDERLSSSAPKIFREHCRIDWTKNATEIHNRIRGLSPRPGAFTTMNGTTLKIYRSKVDSESISGSPGEILCAGSDLRVACGAGSVRILQIQQEGKKILSAEEFLRGFPLKKGDRFE